MALINQNSIIGVTSITSPSASNVLTVHTNDTTERLRVSTSGVSFSGTSASLDTSGNLTVSGNVSIGGTLTYEDVTNIDAVGIITANAGIHLDDVLSHKGNTNTKIRFPAADTITAETAATERLRITSAGLVGIGTNIPENGLHVSDGSSFAAPQNSGAGRIMIEHGSSADLQFMTANSGYNHIFFGDQDDANAGVIYYQHNSGVNAMVFSTNAAERLRILSDGKVAIGDVTANSQLDVHGGDGISITSSGDTFLQSRTTGTTGTNYLEFKDSGGGSGAISYHHNGNSMRFKVAGSERLRIDSSGRTLIGLNSSLLSYAGLQIKGDADNGAHICLANKTAAPTSGQNIGSIRFTNNAGGIGALIGVEGDGTWSGSSYPSRIIFATTASGATSGTERLRIISSGEVSIGGFAPTAGAGILQISGGLRVAGSASASDTITPYIYRTSGSDHLNIATSGSERVRIASNGTTTVGPQYDRVTIEPGNGTYDGEATTLTVDGRTNDGNRVALKVDRYDSGTSATTKFSVKYDGAIFTTSGMQASSVNLQNSSTSSWFQTGTSIASYPYVWAAKNSSSNIWHSGLQTDGDLYLGGNLAGTNNIALNGSNGSGWFTGGLGIGGNAAANTMDEYEEGTWTPVMNKSGVAGTAGTPSTGVGYYRRVGQLLWISFYWYKGSGAFGNNAGEWYVSGVPFLLAHGSGSGYQFIPGGYNNINGTNYANQSNRWQSNNTNGSQTLAMYGPNSTTNWTSGYAEFSASGCLMLP